jgi:hypothetical protein
MVQVEGLPERGVAMRCGEGMRYVHLIDMGLSAYNVTGGRARYLGAAIMLWRLRRFNGAG